jgi:hypothetical protein
MKYIRLLLAVVTGSLVFLSNVPQVTAGPTNTTYRVRVVSSFGTNFTHCFRFDTPNLTIDGLFQAVTYRHGQLDTLDERFKAVSRSFQPLAIMFFGEAMNTHEGSLGSVKTKVSPNSLLPPSRGPMGRHKCKPNERQQGDD